MTALDQLDQSIINMLAEDARISNRQIAAELSVTEGTIRSRIRRLQREGLIRFTLVTDFRLSGSPNLVMFGITAEPGLVLKLLRQTADMPELNCVMLMLGEQNIMAMGLFSSMEQIYETLHGKLLRLAGVKNIEVSVALHTLKYDARKARIIQASGDVPEEID